MKSIDKIAKDVKIMTKEIEEAKIKLNQNQGRIQELMKQLEEKYDFDNIDDAQKSLEEKIINIDNLGRQINEKYRNLCEALDA